MNIKFLIFCLISPILMAVQEAERQIDITKSILKLKFYFHIYKLLIAE
jgi:hypothetical protein